MTNVKLKAPVQYSALEKACFDAATELGWKPSSIDKYNKEYQLGSLHENQAYRYTAISADGRLAGIEVIVFLRSPSCQAGQVTVDSFSVFPKFPFLFTTDRMIEDYLFAVSKKLDQVTA